MSEEKLSGVRVVPSWNPDRKEVSTTATDVGYGWIQFFTKYDDGTFDLRVSHISSLYPSCDMCNIDGSWDSHVVDKNED